MKAPNKRSHLFASTIAVVALMVGLVVMSSDIFMNVHAIDLRPSVPVSNAPLPLWMLLEMHWTAVVGIAVDAGLLLVVLWASYYGTLPWPLSLCIPSSRTDGGEER